MALTIPAQIEQDFQSGKALYKTFQTGFGPQSVLNVSDNTYVIIFGYVFNPAGGGFTHNAINTPAPGDLNQIMPFDVRQFGTQQILIYTGEDFFPFMHHVNITSSPVVQSFDVATGVTSAVKTAYEVDNTPQTYSTYINANKPVSIAHSLVDVDAYVTLGAIPISPETPSFLSYAGTGGLVPVQTNFNTGTAQPNQFLQPYFQKWSVNPYAYGVIPAGALEQAWVRPDSALSGAFPAATRLTGLNIGTQITSNYILTLHYALYQQNDK